MLHRFSQGKSEALVGTFKKCLFWVKFSEPDITLMTLFIRGELNKNMLPQIEHLSLQYSHVTLVSRYPILTVVN